jgi:hypothetical protein
MSFERVPRRFVRWMSGCLLAGVACAPVTVTTQGTSNDGGVVDAGIDAYSGADGAGGGLPDADVCMPGDVATYHPDYHAPGVQPDACDDSPELVGQFFDACFGASATTDDCDDFRAAHPTCAGCIVTPDSAMNYGPIVDHGGFVTANVAGCIDLEVESAVDAGGGALGCAHAVQALEGCELAACEANCPVDSSPSLMQFQGCATSADGTGCSMLAQAAACTATDSGADVPTECLTTDFATFYNVVVPLFCLPAPSLDAGAASPPDAYAGD